MDLITRGALTADHAGFTFLTEIELDHEPVDVLFDDHRVWSTVVESAASGTSVRLDWPHALAPHVEGSGLIAVARSSDSAMIASAECSIGRADRPRELVDSLGRWLAMNKWDQLGVPIDGQQDGGSERLLVDAQRLIDELATLGHRAFLSSGSLLGAIRTGEFLPHDDDIDLGDLRPESAPTELILESLALERSLVEAGHVVVRHSYAHIQVVYLLPGGEVDHYIDIFTAYFEADGTFSQPFSIRGPLERDAMVPFSRVELEGHDFPAPATPSSWLTANYGPGWLVPDPAFRFEIPATTTRHFDSWFGTYNLHRDFWSELHGGRSVEPAADAGRIREVLARSADRGDTVVDLGCGLSGLPGAVRADGFDALAVDFSRGAVRAQSALGVDAEVVNLNQRREVLGLAAALASRAARVHFVLDHTLEGLDIQGNTNVFLLLRWILRDGAVAVIDLDTDLPSWHRFDDPESWHIPLPLLRSRAEEQGLTVEVLDEYERATPSGPRRSALAVVRRGEDATRTEASL